MRNRHMLLVVLVVIAAVAWVGRLTGDPEREPQLAQSTQGSVTTGPERTSPGASTSHAELDEVQKAAVAGVTAWQDRDAAARNAALALVATPEYAAALAGVDPAVVPECTADDVRTDVESDGLARVNVTCHTGIALDVDVTLEDAEWRVSDIAPGA